MKRQKHLRMGTAALLLASTTVAVVAPIETSAASFKDVKPTDYYYNAIKTLTNEKVINGYGDGTFRPYVNTTRGHIAVVLTKILNLRASQTIQIADMSTNHNLYTYAAAAIEHGIMTTDTEGKFNPKNEISRYEYAEILMRAYNIQPLTNTNPFKSIPEKYKTAVQAVYDHGIMHGVSTTNFGGAQKVTRGQMAATILNARTSIEKTQTRKLEIESYNVQTGKIATDKGTYTVSSNVKPFFSTANKALLNGAIIEAKVVNREIVSLQNVEIIDSDAYATISDNSKIAAISSSLQPTFAATTKRTLNLGGVEISGSLKINRDYVTVRNGKVGSITVTDEADKEFTLYDIVVKNLLIEDGYSRNFDLELNNTTVSQFEVDRDRIILNSNKKMPQLLLGGNVYDITLYVPVGYLHLVKGGYVTVNGTSAIDKIFIPEEAYLYMNAPGNIQTIEVLDEDTTLYLARNVGVGAVVIPVHADYTRILSSSGNIKDVVGKVNYPNSTQNLFASEVDLPTKEEIAYEEAFNNLVNEVTSTTTGNVFTLNTKLNGISSYVRELPVETYFVVENGLEHLNATDTIPLKITRAGSTTTHNVTVAQLRSGFTLSSLTGKKLIVKDYAPNSNNRMMLEFNTPYPATIRANVMIGGYTKGSTRSQINKEYAEQISSAIEYLNVEQTTKGIKFEKKYNTITDALVNKSTDVKMSLVSSDNTQADNTIIPMTIKYEYEGKEKTVEVERTVAQLKQGVSLYSLLGLSNQTLKTTDSTKIEKWEVEVLLKGTIKLDTYVDSQMSLSKGQAVDVKMDKVYGVGNFEVTADTNNLNVVTTFKDVSAVDSATKELLLDADLKVVSGLENIEKDIEFDIYYNDKKVKEGAKENVSNLKAGVLLSKFVGKSVKLGDHTDREDKWRIELKNTAEPIEVEVALLVGTKKLKPHRVILNQANIATLANTIDSITATTAKNSFSTNLKFKNITDLNTQLQSLTVDSKIQVETALKKEKYKISATFNDQPPIEKYVTANELMNGINLSKILGITQPSLASHLGTETKWKFEIKDVSTSEQIKAKIQMVLGGYPVGPINTITVNLQP